MSHPDDNSLHSWSTASQGDTVITSASEQTLVDDGNPSEKGVEAIREMWDSDQPLTIQRESLLPFGTDVETLRHHLLEHVTEDVPEADQQQRLPMEGYYISPSWRGWTTIYKRLSDGIGITHVPTAIADEL